MTVSTHRGWTMLCGGLLAVALLGASGRAVAEDKAPPPKLPDAFTKKSPDSVEDLKVIQEHVAKLVDKVMPCVVCVRIGASFGSGVIVTKDGYVLTAGHVSGPANRDVTVYFANGKTVKGKSLGGNHGIDSGLIKITTPGEWPHLEMGDSAKLNTGDWCIVCSHAGGFKSGRTPPVRLGRLTRLSATTLTSDCCMVGGDSGGPLFDMHGHVIGINSRIGTGITMNMHVPVNPFRESWDKLVAGEVWGGRIGGAPAVGGVWLGVELDGSADGCQIKRVVPDSPAAKGGLKENDIILKFGGKEVVTFDKLAALVQQQKVGSKVAVEIRRGDANMTLDIVLAKR